MHQSSYEKMFYFRDKYLHSARFDALTILDIGSQDVNGTFKPVFDQPSWQYLGADIAAGPNVDIVISDFYRWKAMRSESVDIVISGQALEHIAYFWITMLEIARVLKPGGLCCLIAPSAGPEHKNPIDCWRYYADGFAVLATWARLRPVELYTQWQSREYEDGSHLWKDTFMVCEKPVYPRLASLVRRLKYRLALWGINKMAPKTRVAAPSGTP